MTQPVNAAISRPGVPRAWLQSQGLLRAFDRVYDSEGGLRELPLSHAALLRRDAGRGLTGTSLHQIFVAAAHRHAPLTSLLDVGLDGYRGRPRRHFTADMLTRGFEVTPPGVSAAAVVAATLPALVAPAPDLSPAASAVEVSAAITMSRPAQLAGIVARQPDPLDMPPFAQDDEIGREAAELTLDSETIKEINAEVADLVLKPAWGKLREMSWKSWPYNDGNPFVAKITKANAAKLGVPNYFKVVTAPPMDLTRMEEALKAHEYSSVDGFIEKARAIVANAKLFNCPPSWQHAHDFPHPDDVRATRPAELPDGSVYTMAWELQDAIDKLEPRMRIAWNAHVVGKKRAILMKIMEGRKIR